MCKISIGLICSQQLAHLDFISKMSNKSSPLNKGASLPTSDTVAEATEFVNSVMSSQNLQKVDTPCDKGRKRNLSVSGTSDTTTKKVRNDVSPDIETLRTPIRAKRNLYNKAPEPAPRKRVNGCLDADNDVSPRFNTCSASCLPI